MKKQWGILLALIIVLFIVLFSIANVDNVTFSFLIGTFRLPLILIIVGSVLVGALLTGSFSVMKLYRQERQIAELRRTLRMYEEKHPEDQQRLADEEVSAGEARKTRSSRSRRRSFFKK